MNGTKISFSRAHVGLLCSRAPSVKHFSYSSSRESPPNRITMFIKTGLFLLLLLSTSWAESDQEPEATFFKGYKVLRLKVENAEVLDVLNELQQSGSWDFWTDPGLNSTSDVLVSPEQLPQLTALINDRHVEYQILLDRVDEVVAAEQRISVNRYGNGMNWNSYQRLATIYEWMESLVQSSWKASPNVNVQVLNIGKSFENRTMKVLKISSNWRQTPGKRSAIWIDGGIHAREWISPATVTFIANEVLQASLRAETWASMFDWYIAPCINPDGYEYSHESIQNRFWRKTRSSNREPGLLDSFSNPLNCVGADGNRNWDFHWGELGASRNPCAPNYRGQEAASEIEVQNVQNFLLSHKDELKLYISMHSYSQLILLPWGHSYFYTDDYEDLMNVAERAAERLERVQGTVYRTGATPHILYPASGGSHDWAKGVAGIKYAYTIELPDRGFFGFLLPASRIIPTGEETVELVRSMAENMRDIYYFGKVLT